MTKVFSRAAFLSTLLSISVLAQRSSSFLHALKDDPVESLRNIIKVKSFESVENTPLRVYQVVDSYVGYHAIKTVYISVGTSRSPYLTTWKLTPKFSKITSITASADDLEGTLLSVDGFEIYQQNDGAVAQRKIETKLRIL